MNPNDEELLWGQSPLADTSEPDPEELEIPQKKPSKGQEADGPPRLIQLEAYLMRAAASPRGIRVEFPSAYEAWKALKQCYKIRSKDRKYSKEEFPPNHPRHGVSKYDGLLFAQADEHGPCRITREGCDLYPNARWLELRKYSEPCSGYTVEEL